jgi:hypothetical protein
MSEFEQANSMDGIEASNNPENNDGIEASNSQELERERERELERELEPNIDTVLIHSGASAGVKGIDTLFTLEHQGMIAAKYRAKYSDLEQVSHKSLWPEFKGNHFMMYVLSETLTEARKAVFSANRTILINQLVGAMVNYTPADSTGTRAMTELQVLFNKATDQQLNALTDQLPDESNKTDVLKAYAKTLKQSARTGRDLDQARLKFYHAADMIGVVAGEIW